MTDEQRKLHAGLKTIRRRRLLLWGIILIYMPSMWVALQVTGSIGGTMPLFGVWFVLLCFAAGFSAAARCPRCGNYFHMHGMSLMYLRRCLHCTLHLNADKQQ